MKRVIVGLLALSLGAWAQAPQGSAPVQQAPLAPKATASIEGSVRSQDGDRPIRKAMVQLIPEGVPTIIGQGNAQMETDAEGHFEFKDLAPGRYRFLVRHSNFVGSDRAGRSKVTVINLGEDEHAKDVVLRLAAAAVIRGHISDEDGDPMVRVSVQAMQQRYSRGKKQWIPASTASTDDQGDYRIHGLSPGLYYVATSPMTLVTPMNQPQVTRDYVRTFYPSSVDAQGASPVEVKAGDEVPINFAMMKRDVALVHGTIVSAGGEKPAMANVTFVPADDPFSISRMQGMARNGVFDLRVPPGRYRVTAMIPNDAGNGQFSSVSTSVDVPEAGLPDFKLQAASPAKLTAQVRVEGSADTKIENLRLQFMPHRDDGNYFGMFMPGDMGSGKPDKDGVVQIERLNPGTYDVSWFPQGSGWQDAYLKSVVQGSRDVSDSGVRVSGSSAQIEVVISATAARLDGTVVDADQHPVKSAYIVAVPEPQFRSRDQYYRTSVSDQNGHFQIRGLRPGRYTILALEDPESGAWMDPDFLKQVEGRGETLSVGENDRKQMQLRLITAEAQASKQ